MLYSLIQIFGVITVLMGPIYYFYGQGTAYEHYTDGALLKYTLGNLG